MQLEDALTHYDIGDVVAVTPWSGGTANQNYRVETGRGQYFVKRRTRRLSAHDHVRLQHSVLQHLAGDGLPVCAPLPLRDSAATFVADGDCVWEVTPFTEGRTFTGSEKEIGEAAKTLARIHLSLRNFEVPSFARGKPLHENSEQIAGSLAEAEPLMMKAGLAVQVQALRECYARLEREYYGPLEPVLGRSIIHGDYHAWNMLFDDGKKVIGVFDFDATGVQIRLRDVVDGLITFGRRESHVASGKDIVSLTRAFDFDTERMRVFAQGYGAILPFSDVERVALPLMLRQRWLGIKLDPLRLKKVDAVGAVAVLQDAHLPLRWLDEHEAELGGVLSLF